MNLLNLFLRPFLWILWFLLNIILGAVGLILIPIALRNYWTCLRFSQTIPNKKIVSWSKSWMWIWGNEEDGIDPEWYRLANLSMSPFRRVFTWSAVRNSVNNLQRVKYLNCPTLKPGELKTKSWKYGNFNWTGPYAGGQLFLFGKTFNYGYGFIPWEAQVGMPENDTRDIPYISQHWS